DPPDRRRQFPGLLTTVRRKRGHSSLHLVTDPEFTSHLPCNVRQRVTGPAREYGVGTDPDIQHTTHPTAHHDRAGQHTPQSLVEYRVVVVMRDRRRVLVVTDSAGTAGRQHCPTEAQAGGPSQSHERKSVV